MKLDIKAPTIVRRIAPKAKTEIGDAAVASAVRLQRLREIKPPTLVRRVTPKAKTEIGDMVVASTVRLHRLRNG